MKAEWMLDARKIPDEVIEQLIIIQNYTNAYFVSGRRKKDLILSTLCCNDRKAE